MYHSGNSNRVVMVIGGAAMTVADRERAGIISP
jgi:hypothetical protein